MVFDAANFECVEKLFEYLFIRPFARLVLRVLPNVVDLTQQCQQQLISIYVGQTLEDNYFNAIVTVQKKDHIC